MENTHNDTGKRAAESSFFQKFTRTAEEYLNKPTRLKKLLHDVYQQASEQKQLGAIATEVWESFQRLYRLIKAATSGEYHGIERKTLLMGIAVLIYLLSPIDLIPDFIPVIGLLDDAALLAWFLTSIKTELEHFTAWEETQAANQGAAGSSENASEENQAPATRGANVDNSDQWPKYAKENDAVVDQYDTAGQGKLLVEDLTITGTETGEAGNQGKGEGRTPSSPEPSPTGAAPTGAGEPSAVANTTDSTRIPNSNASDATSGGNVR
ncbi:hypothetical protein BH24BAC1_BH24BAC1_07500 [soil metagenome]